MTTDLTPDTATVADTAVGLTDGNHLVVDALKLNDVQTIALYEHSLAIAFFVLFFASWVLHAMGGAKAFNEEQLQHGEAAISVWRYVTTSQFWFESM